MSVQTKICGIKTPEALRAASDGGARFVGFVFYPPSPRHVERNIAKELSLMLPTGVRSVALFVDPSDADLESVLGHVQIDMIQLHGSETPRRVSEIKARYNIPVIKVFPISILADLEAVDSYQAADWYLFDAKSADANMPGGTGHSFDWSILQGREFDKPWMLSGGLTPENVGEALSALSPMAVDVSSGVESARGVKDEVKIKAFLVAVQSC